MKECHSYESALHQGWSWHLLFRFQRITIYSITWNWQWKKIEGRTMIATSQTRDIPCFVQTSRSSACQLKCKCSWKKREKIQRKTFSHTETDSGEVKILTNIMLLTLWNIASNVYYWLNGNNQVVRWDSSTKYQWEFMYTREISSHQKWELNIRSQ